MRTLLILLVPVPVLAMLTGCTSFSSSAYRTFEQYGEPSGEFRDMPLASGQIVVSGSASAMDIALALMPAEFSPYIHMGIVAIEDGVPYVYEELGEPSLNLDPEIPPTATVEGAVKRTLLERFAARYYYVEIYEPAGADREKVAEFGRRHFEAQTPFDKFFDYTDDSAFYCAEFVARALEAGGSDALALTQNRSNRSISILMDWLQVPETTLDAQGMVDASQPVLLISQHSKTEILTLNEIKRELYRRFTADQTLGNLFRWNVTRPALRFPVDFFFRRSMMRTDGMVPDQQQIAAAVRQVADELFGEFPPPGS